MNGPYTERAYRVESWAVDARINQQLTNVFRRLFGLPIVKYGWQVEEEVKRAYLAVPLSEQHDLATIETAAAREQTYVVDCVCVAQEDAGGLKDV